MNHEPNESDKNTSQNAMADYVTASGYPLGTQSPARDLETYESMLVGTMSSGSLSKYPHTLPKDLLILHEVIEGLSTVQNERVRQMLSCFLLAFERIIAMNRNAIESTRNLPTLRFRLLDDGAVLIEWIFKDFRIGFSIEADNTESSWYLVSNDNVNEESKSGSLNVDDIDTTLSDILNFVLNYT